MVDALIAAARIVAASELSHSDECSMAVFDGLPCLCGLDQLRQALKAIDQEQADG